MEDWANKNYNRNFASGAELDDMSPIGLMDVAMAIGGLLGGAILAGMLLFLSWAVLGS